ncbi:MAG: SDR family oxidoreductase [Gammaproteobacteria bacterium]|jgi:NAD(P)-dependent dehydrogenase (short-subunit alcohol dehydrogenase family)
MPSILITGSNRGLGLEWARQYAQEDWRVYATCRHPQEATELHELAERHPDLSVHRLDVTRQAEIQALAADLGQEPIDMLLNNAGVYLEKFDDAVSGGLSYDNWLYTLLVNTLGPMRVSEAFIPHLARSDRRLVITITSHMGSIAEISSPGSYYYRSSKAALNASMKGLSLELRMRGIGVVLLHPGWVQTRMGGPGAQITPAQSVSGMRTIVEHFRLADSGRFFRYNGTEIPW